MSRTSDATFAAHKRGNVGYRTAALRKNPIQQNRSKKFFLNFVFGLAERRASLRQKM